MGNVNTRCSSRKHDEMMEILQKADNSTGLEKKNLKQKIITYLLSLGTAFNSETRNANLLNSLHEDVKKQLLDPLLFNDFTSNKIKITPEVRDDWKVDYKYWNVFSGYVILASDGDGTNNRIRIPRVPITNFLNLMKDGILNERGENDILETRGSLIIGRFIINKERKLYSEAFYNFWKEIHFPERNNNEEEVDVSWKVNKDNLREGAYYKIPCSNNQLTIEKYLGQKHIIKYKILDNELIPLIQKKRLALRIHIRSYNLSQKMSEKVYGIIKNLSPYKKLQYFEEIQNLPFIDQIGEEDIIKKTDYNNVYNNIVANAKYIGMFNELPQDYKKNPGFEIVRSGLGELCNIILYKGEYFLGNNWILPETITDGPYSIYPNYVLIPDRLKIGRISVVHVNSTEGHEKYSSICGNRLNFNRNLDNCYRLVPTTISSRNNFLNFEDGFQL